MPKTTKTPGNSRKPVKDRQKPLSDRQKAFLDEYLVDLNISAAGRRAGYSPRGCYNTGKMTLARDDAQRYLAERNLARQQRTEVDQDRVILELARVAFLDAGAVFDAQNRLLAITDMPQEVRAAISACDVTMRNGYTEAEEPVAVVRLRFHDKMNALGKLMEHLRLGAATGKEDDPIHKRGFYDMPVEAMRKEADRLFAEFDQRRKKR